MPDTLPSISVIIACRPNQEVVLAAAAARRFDYPKDKLEIILARGKQPSIQRNTALHAAKGDLICFLDDDSVAPPDHLQRAVSHFKDQQVQMVGGPNLCPPDAPELEQVFAVTHASWLAFGPSRARYLAVGQVRASGEKELILCNLFARRQPMLELGGFDEKMYPNEENALMDDLQKRGGRLIYDPELSVHRRPRKTLWSFVKMLFSYGRGRAEQVRLHPTLGALPNLAPVLFCLYVISLPIFVLTRVNGVQSEFMGVSSDITLRAFKTAVIWPLPRFLLPLALYAVLVLGDAIVDSTRFGVKRSCCSMPLVFLTHTIYGLGFWRGLFKKIGRPANEPPVEVKLEHVSV